jgi:hypothetical protein
MSAILVEVVLMRFRKIPFTCSMAPFKETSIVAVLIYIVGFFAFVDLTAAIEERAFLEPAYWIFFVIFFGAVWAALRQWRASLTYIDQRIIFEDQTEAAVEAMNLGYGR